MLTLIYCSSAKNKSLEEKLIHSSGLEDIEVIHLDEVDHAKGYNKGLKKALGNIVVFIRQEVEIRTQNWGQKVLEAFEKSDYAILGTVGTISVPMSGMLWEKQETLVGRMWYEKFDLSHEERFSETFRGKIIPVVALEGSFIACHKERLFTNFDEKYINDSYYDIDFCVENFHRNAKIGVFFDVKILKLTFDEQDDDFMKNHKHFSKKHKDKLPYRLKPDIIFTQEKIKLKETPTVGMIIINKGKPSDLFSCLESIYEKCDYANRRIFIVDIGSTKEEITQIESFIGVQEDTILIEVESDHVPSIYNGVAKSLSKDVELIMFIEREIVMLNDVISRMVNVYLENKSECGTIGARIHTRNHMVRHFGIEILSQEYEDEYELSVGYQGFGFCYRYKNLVRKGVLGSSKELLMIPRNLFDFLEGFDGGYYYSLYDFDLNIRSLLEGKKNFLVGNAVCYYLGHDRPKFLPDDFDKLVEFINEHTEALLPYVNLVNAS